MLRVKKLSGFIFRDSHGMLLEIDAIFGILHLFKADD